MKRASDWQVSSARPLRWVWVLTLSAAIADAATTPRTPVSDLRPLMTQAIAEGSARGRLVGPGADYIARRFGFTSPIEVDVLRMHAENKPGCARLKVITRQKGAANADQGRDQELVYQVSYCADGRLLDKS